MKDVARLLGPVIIGVFTLLVTGPSRAQDAQRDGISVSAYASGEDIMVSYSNNNGYFAEVTMEVTWQCGAHLHHDTQTYPMLPNKTAKMWVEKCFSLSSNTPPDITNMSVRIIGVERKQ
jgi:hypothetical protein